MEKLDEGFKTLLEQGTRRGFLNYDQLNDNLPGEVSSSPEKLHELLERLLAERAGRDRLRDLEGALAETDPAADPASYQELWREKMRLNYELSRMVATKKSSDAS